MPYVTKTRLYNTFQWQIVTKFRIFRNFVYETLAGFKFIKSPAKDFETFTESD